MASQSFPPRPELELLVGGRELARSRRTAGPHVSRSYSGPYALIASHHHAVGVDIEWIEPASEAFCESICTPEERSLMLGASAERVASLWSSKEALAKALGDALDYDPRRLGAPVFWTGGAAGRWRARQLTVPAGYTGWVCWAA